MWNESLPWAKPEAASKHAREVVWHQRASKSGRWWRRGDGYTNDPASVQLFDWDVRTIRMVQEGDRMGENWNPVDAKDILDGLRNALIRAEAVLAP